MVRRDPNDQRISIFLSPNELHGLFEKLANDDNFRRRLRRNPQGTLADHHIHIPSELIPEPIVLPSKQVLRRSMEHWHHPEYFPFVMFNYVPVGLPFGDSKKKKPSKKRKTPAKKRR